MEIIKINTVEKLSIDSSNTTRYLGYPRKVPLWKLEFNLPEAFLHTILFLRDLPHRSSSPFSFLVYSLAALQFETTQQQIRSFSTQLLTFEIELIFYQSHRV